MEVEKEKIFAIGDVHGQITMLEELLDYWKPKEEQLLFIGDLADRGESSKAVFERVQQLIKIHDAIVVKGNHDQMLENYLKNPAEHVAHYYMNGGQQTVDSLLEGKTNKEDFVENAKQIKALYPWLLPFLEGLPLYYEWGDYLFVHAGVDLQLDDWRDSTPRDFIWIRDGFYDQSNQTNKKIVFGHTVTATLHGQMDNYAIWESGDGLIGIDGGAVYGGELHGLVFSKEKILKQYTVENKGFRF